MDFKFFQKAKPKENMYLCYHMDEVLIHVLRYKQIHNQEIINGDTLLENVNVPISNCWMRILTWRNYTNTNPEMIEIDYRIFETNNMPRNYTYRASTDELLRRLNITRL